MPGGAEVSAGAECDPARVPSKTSIQPPIAVLVTHVGGPDTTKVQRRWAGSSPLGILSGVGAARRCGPDNVPSSTPSPRSAVERGHEFLRFVPCSVVVVISTTAASATQVAETSRRVPLASNDGLTAPSA